MKLITEHTEDVQYLEEKVGDKKNLFIKGVFLQAEQKNRNGRVYPFPILEREVKRYNDKYIDQNRAFGELGHPQGPTVNLDRVSHMITELHADGNNFVGKARTIFFSNDKKKGSFFKIWKWNESIRFNRFFKKIK